MANKKIYIILCMVFCLAVASGVSLGVGEVSYWQLSELTDLWGTNDLSNTGAISINNYPSFNTSGSGSPNCSYFDGNDYHSVADNPSLNFAEFSVSLWYNTTASEWTAYHTLIAQWYQDGLDGWRLFGNNGAGDRLTFTVAGSGNQYNLNSINGALDEDSLWHHVVGIYNGTHVMMYLDGVYQGNASAPDFDHYSDELYIGTRAGNDGTGLTNYFVGSVDEVQLFNRSLNSTEVLELYNSGNISGGGVPPAGANQTITLNSPSNGGSNVDDKVGSGISANLNVSVTDAQGDNMDVSFYMGNGTLIGTNNGVTNGSSTNYTWSGLSANTTYTWYVYVTDGTNTTTSNTWSFTTREFEGIRVQARDYFSNTSITNFTAHIVANWFCGIPPCPDYGSDHSISTKSTTNGTVWFNISGGSSYSLLTITGIDNYHNLSLSSLTINETTTYITYPIPYINYTIYALDLLNNATLTNFTTNITGYGLETSSNNKTSYLLPLGSYNITLDATGTHEAYYITTQNISVTNATASQNITISTSKIAVGNCSTYPYPLITFYGKDESTLVNISDMKLNIALDLVRGTQTQEYSFGFDGNSSYSLCVPENTTYTLSAVMEYGDGDYSDRKYYLVNTTLDAADPTDLILYHLNNSITTEVIMIVYDVNTGARVNGAYIKTRRYYPETDTYLTVEVEKTDESGKTLGKFVIADVFYDFIIEYPAGTIKLDTDVQKILSTQKEFGISLAGNPLGSWEDILGIDVNVSCTKSTGTCRFNWDDTTGTPRLGTLKVYRLDGYGKTKIYEASTTSTSANIVYTINESVANKEYTAIGTMQLGGIQEYVGEGNLYFDGYCSNNAYFDEASCVAAGATWSATSLFGVYADKAVELLIPSFLLFITIVAAVIDIGAVAVVVGSMLALVTLVLIGVLPIGYITLISVGILAGILIYKMKK